MWFAPSWRDLPLLDEDVARQRCLRSGAEAPDLATVKGFLRFYVATSRPQLSNKPTVDSINTVTEWFFAGFTRVTGTDTNEQERGEVYDVSCSARPQIPSSASNNASGCVRFSPWKLWW